MKRILFTACWFSGTLMASDTVVKDPPGPEGKAGDMIVGVTSMRIVRKVPSMAFSRPSLNIRMHCVFPFTGMLFPEQPEQDGLRVTDSNGVALKVKSVKMNNEWVRDRTLRKVNVSIALEDVPSPGAVWVRIQGDLLLSLSGEMEVLDFGKVELNGTGVTTVPMLDPVAVRDKIGKADIADLDALGMVTLEVTKLEDEERRRPGSPGDEWKFIVYSNSMFQAEDFVFHDLQGMKLKPVRTCDYTVRSFHEHKGKSFLFRDSPDFVDVSVLYQGPTRLRRVPVDLKAGIGGAVPVIPACGAESPEPQGVRK